MTYREIGADSVIVDIRHGRQADRPIPNTRNEGWPADAPRALPGAAIRAKTRAVSPRSHQGKC